MPKPARPSPADQPKRPRKKRRKASPAKSDAAPKAGRGGVVPPAEHQFPPGVSGNPKGRPPNAGSTMREWVNQLVAAQSTEADLRKLARDPHAPVAKRNAAINLLFTIELPDPADFQEVLSGEKTLADLRDEGVATHMVKKIKCKRLTTTTAKGHQSEQEDYELELHNRAGDAFDRIVGHTDGTPTQRVEFVGDALPAAIMILTPLTAPPEHDADHGG
jgi:hypothetical protein